MTQYLYPQNLKATANLWLWGFRDFAMNGEQMPDNDGEQFYEVDDEEMEE